MLKFQKDGSTVGIARTGSTSNAALDSPSSLFSEGVGDQTIPEKRMSRMTLPHLFV
jgi:hypothetical protein